MAGVNAFLTGDKAVASAGLNVAAAIAAALWIVIPGPATGALLALLALLSLALFAAATWARRYPDWPSLGPALLAYIVAWAVVDSGRGLEPIVLPEWFVAKPSLPVIGETSPIGLGIPVVACVALLLIVISVRSVSLTLFGLTRDILFVVLYTLVVSILPESALVAIPGGWLAVFFVVTIAAWQISWLFLSRRERSWQMTTSLSSSTHDLVALLSDLSYRPRWMLAIESDVRQSDGSFLETIRSGSQRMFYRLRVSERIEGRCVIVALEHPTSMIEEYDVLPTAHGSRVTLTHRWKVSYALALVGAYVWMNRFGAARRSHELSNLTRLDSLATSTPAS